MNADQLLAYYEIVADATDAVPRLRRFIRDYAVRGKLVAQSPRDEPASELLSRIAEEKERLTNAGEAKKKTTKGSVSPAHVPFDVPEGWAWSTIGFISSKTGSGSTPRGGKESYKGSGIVFLRSQNVYDDGLRLDEVAYIDRATHVAMSGTVVQASDLLLNITGGSIGRCCVVPGSLGPTNINQHVSIIRIAIAGLQRFVHAVVLSSYFQDSILDEQTGAGRGGLPKRRMDLIPVPLPPLAEQYRIVARLDELMALCDRLERAREERESTRDRFALAALARLHEPASDEAAFRQRVAFVIDNLPSLTTRPDQISVFRKTIIRLAMRGKLAPQDPNEDPAAKLIEQNNAQRARLIGRAPLQRHSVYSSADDEAVFDIPATWSWVKLGDIVDFAAGRTPSRNEPTFWNSGDYAWVSIRDMVDGKTVTSTNETITKRAAEQVFGRQPEQVGTMLMSFKLTIGKMARLGIPAYHNEAIVSIKPYVAEIDPYLYMVLPYSARRGNAKSAVKGATLNRKSISNIAIPLPGLAEQSRIVVQVRRLMCLFDRLEAGLETIEDMRRRLLQAWLDETLSIGRTTRSVKR